MPYESDLREIERQQRKIEKTLRAFASQFGFINIANKTTDDTDEDNKHKVFHKVRDTLYDYEIYDDVYTPRKPVFAISFIFFAVAAFLFACAITHGVNDVTEQENFVPYIGDPLGIVLPIVVTVCGFLIAAWSHIARFLDGMRVRLTRRKERRFLRKFRHIDGILSRECHHVLFNVISDKKHNGRISGDYLLVHDAGFLLSTLSLGRAEDKTVMIQELCYPMATTKTYSLNASDEHIAAGKEFLSELESVCRIWEHSLKISEYGDKLTYCPHSKKSRKHIKAETARLAKELGVDQALELYYDGVPVADIVC